MVRDRRGVRRCLEGDVAFGLVVAEQCLAVALVEGYTGRKTLAVYGSEVPQNDVERDRLCVARRTFHIYIDLRGSPRSERHVSRAQLQNDVRVFGNRYRL